MHWGRQHQGRRRVLNAAQVHMTTTLHPQQNAFSAAQVQKPTRWNRLALRRVLNAAQVPMTTTLYPQQNVKTPRPVTLSTPPARPPRHSASQVHRPKMHRGRQHQGRRRVLHAAQVTMMTTLPPQQYAFSARQVHSSWMKARYPVTTPRPITMSIAPARTPRYRAPQVRRPKMHSGW